MSSAHPSAPISGPDAQSPLENFLDLHSRKVLIGIAAVLVIAAIFTGLHLKRKNHERTAGSALVAAQDLDGLRKVISDYADTPAGQTAQILLSDRQLKSGDAKGAADTLRGFLSANPKHPLTSQARIALASTLATLGEPDQANAELSTFLSTAATSPLAPLAMIMQAEIAEKKGDTAAAKKLYAEVKAAFPESQFAETADLRLERVGFIMPTEVEPPPPPPAQDTPMLDSNQPLPIPGAPGTAPILPLDPVPSTGNEAPQPPPPVPAPGNP